MKVFGTRPKTYICAYPVELLTTLGYAVTGGDVSLFEGDRLESFPCASC